MSGPVFEQCAGDEESVKAVEIYKPFAIILTIQNTLFYYYISEQRDVKTHLDIWNIRHHHKGTLRKPVLD